MSKSKPLFMYGDDSCGIPEEDQAAIVEAFSLLLSEMNDFFKHDDDTSAFFEADEGQALLAATRERIGASAEELGFGNLFEEELDPESEKESARIDSAHRTGSYERRLHHITALQKIFAEKLPSEVSRDDLASAHQIFKDQVMRHAMELAAFTETFGVLMAATSVKTYAKAILACHYLDERWEEDYVYPFADPE